jgi:UDP-N-acetyl-D-glucosamine dehydrogenase
VRVVNVTKEMTMIISVVGLGKIGLPLAVQYASKGHTVLGVDIDQKTVDLVNAGREPFPGEAGLADALPGLREQGLLSATTSYESAIPQSDAVVVVVPLFVDENDKPDFGWMDSATKSIGTNLTSNTLVIYETTLPIGTTRNRWKPMLERESELQEGHDFHVVFSPERVLTGRVFEDLKKYPKLVGGLSPRGTEKAIDFYGSVLDFDTRVDLPRENDVWDLGSAEAAEMAKLAETTYRDVNIALANQFALHAQDVGIDIYKVIEACNSQPYSHIHRPGISVGGHCIPVYPRLYLSSDLTGGVVAEARRLNSEMPMKLLDRFSKMIGGLSGKTVLVLGIAYRGGVKEDAFSGVYSIVSYAEALGASVVVSDPLYDDKEIKSLGLTPLGEREQPEVIVFHTDHDTYSSIGSALFPSVRYILDGRARLDPALWPGVRIMSI